MKTRLLVAGILACALVLPAVAATSHGDVPMAESLQADAKKAQSGKMAIMLLFASPYCPYCERVKVEYLGPMGNDPAYRDKVIIRQIEAGSDWALIGFDGKKTTHGAFAASQKIVLVPTVKFYDPQGREVAKPIVGMSIPDFYYGYIQDAVEESLEKIRGKKK